VRLVKIAVPEDDRDPIVSVLRDYEFGYTETTGSGDTADLVIVSFVVPADAVEHVLADLAEAGFDRTAYTVSIDAEFATYEGVDEVQDYWANTPNRLAPAALRSKAKDLRRNTRSYLWLMVLSAIVATAGLLLSSPAVVVGSMVIAPIVSPALTASVGAVRNDRDMFFQSVYQQAIGLGVAILTAAVTAWVALHLRFVPVTLGIEHLELVSPRVSPTILSLIVGLAAGAAGAFGLATEGQVSIVGVMIAAALIPTAATVGIGIAWGNSLVAVGALLLLVVSIIGINAGGDAMLFYLDYRPDAVDQGLFSISDTRDALLVGGTTLFVLVAVGTAGVGFYQQSTFERSVNDVVTEVIDQAAYDGLEVRSVQSTFVSPSGDAEPSVTVTVTRTVDRPFPDLPTVLDARLSARTGRSLGVQVRYVDYHRSSARLGPRARALDPPLPGWASAVTRPVRGA